jgi:single-stranded DNA-binding protein
MGDTSYISTIVKVLETPNQKFFNNTLSVTRFRAQLPQIRNTRIVNLIFWGNLAKTVANYYQTNDYMMIEGYLSLNNKYLLNTVKPNSKKVEITVLKVYPFSNRLIEKK